MLPEGMGCANRGGEMVKSTRWTDAFEVVIRTNLQELLEN